MLTARSVEVLHALVESYIETGEPVASGRLARKRKDHLSAATIRNIMADLAEMGYLDQPHTSAGRVPTAKAFEHFARTAAGRSAPGADVHTLREELGQRSGPEERAEHSSHLLTALTRQVGIVAAIPSGSQSLDQIELVRLPDSRVLMIVITRDGMVRNRVAQLAEQVSSEDLISIRNFVNRNFSGWTLHAIRKELGLQLQEERATYDGLLRKLSLLYNQGLLNIGMVPQVFLDGTSYLVGLDLHLTKEKMREVFRALEEKERLIELLDQFLGGAGGEVLVQVGLGGAHPAMSELSLIGVNVELPGGLETRMAVLGPIRMNYPRVMATVLHLGQALKSLPQ